MIVSYPVEVPSWDGHRSKAGEFNRVARLVIDHINKEFAASGRDSMGFETSTVARELKEDPEIVGHVMAAIRYNGSYNGVTIHRV